MGLASFGESQRAFMEGLKWKPVDSSRGLLGRQLRPKLSFAGSLIHI